MKKHYLLSLIVPLMILSSCDLIPLDIVVTMFPQEDIVRAIVGDKLSIATILPTGIDVHDFEASSQDIVRMNEAKLVIYTSPVIDPWMNESSLNDEDTKVIDLSSRYEHDEQLEEDGHEHDAIHYWVDPLAIVDLTASLLVDIIALDPSNEAYYDANANEYMIALSDAYDEFMAYLHNRDFIGDTIYFAGHDAMGLFASRHEIIVDSLFDDFKPDEDLDSAQLIHFVTSIKATGSHHLFVEAMVNPKAALTIKAELAKEDYDLELLELHSFHNRSSADVENGVTYLDLYERNIANIKLALEG